MSEDKKYEARKKEAKFLMDKSVMETGKNKQLSMLDAFTSLKVEPENYRKIMGLDYSLSEVHSIYKKHFHMEDTKRIDVVLAVALSRRLKGIPLWLILVGASGDMKSVQLNSFRDEDVFVLHNLTSKTLVNGFKDKEKYPDLAPLLDNKLVVIPDMAQILKLPPNEKGELWGQLRDLYDGMAGKVSGMGSTARYEDLHITLLAGSTPSIDGQILIHQDLGTRELIYRTQGNIDKKKSMLKCFENEEFEEEIKTELRDITQGFLKSIEIERTELSEKDTKELMNLATYISYMRATADIDSYSSELRNFVYPEEPTRIVKQLKRLLICIKSLEKDYSEERAYEILWHIAKSSAFPVRTKIFEYLLKTKKEFSTNQLSQTIKIGKTSAKRELGVLWNMGLVSSRKELVNSMYPERTYDYWEINLNHKFIKSLIK
ncbi:MAG: hypothetical protein CMC55_00130 [Flavobacteriaceae bacterium]|nr:hypothetical protein [Flavobacteriaceae bacterium]